MLSQGAILARAVTDGDDCLTSADEPLAALQLQCGGDLPGRIAVPALLETVRKARRYQLKLARMLSAQNGEEAITVWVEVEPREDGEPGCEIRMRNWRTTPLPPDEIAASDYRREDVDRQVAELSAMLDSGQRLLTVEAEAPDLAELAAAMREGMGRSWTDFVRIEGLSHRQPMHWRLLDGAAVTVAGSDRAWRATLIPQALRGSDPAGFELLLIARHPLPVEPSPSRLASGQQAGVNRQLIGHDIAPVLRQPIARIIANAETIRTRLAGPLADDYAQYATDIANAGQLLLGLLEDLSDLEVVEAEDFTTAPDQIDLADVARQAAGILGVRAKEKGIAIDAPRHGESLPATAEFRRVLQILLNLLGNAIRYSPPDSQVWIRLEEDTRRARIIVADQGPGLSEEQAEAVFKKFERLGRSDEGGSGLGLYISRRLARAMGGELTVESAPGRGARFILDLPGPDQPL